MATGVVYYHRFYMFHSFKEFPRYVSFYNQGNLQQESAVAAILSSCMEVELLYLWIFLLLSLPSSFSQNVLPSSCGVKSHTHLDYGTVNLRQQ